MRGAAGRKLRSSDHAGRHTVEARKNPKKPPDLGEALRQAEERFKSLVGLSSDWYWEQDESYRFTVITGSNLEAAVIDPKRILGTARWDNDAVPVGDGGSWEKHKAVLEARRPFSDFVYQRPDSKGELHCISASGLPVFDGKGRFCGYRGVGKDITETQRAEQLQSLEHSVAQWIAEAESVQAAMTAVIRAICETEGWECGRYFRPDQEAGVLRFGESWGVPEPAIQQFIERSRGITYKPGVGLMGRVWQSGQPLWVADVTQDARAIRSAFTDDIGIRGGFVFPVISEAKAIGVLAFNSREARKADERLLKAILAIGGQIGQFLERKRAEEEQRRFRAAMDASADLMLLIDRASMRYIDVNDAACRALGYTREELLAMGPQDIFSKSREELAQLYDRMFASELTAPMVEGVYRCKDGSQLPIEAYPRAVRSAAGDIVVSIARDIRERKRAEQLRELEHAVTSRIANADSTSAALKAVIRAVCETEGWACGRYLRVDEKAGVLRFGEVWSVPDARIERYLEESRAAVYGPGVGLVGLVWQSGQPLWVPDTSKDTRTMRKNLAREIGLHGAIYFPVASEGKAIGVLAFNSREVREPDERLLQAVRMIGSQIGQFVQRKQAEEVLRESEERFRSLTQLSSDMYWEQDEQFRFTSMSGTGSQRVNLKTFPTIGKKRWEQNYTNMTADAWAEHIALLEAHKPFRDMELCRPDESGKKVWISIAGEPVFDSSGAFKGYRGVGKDISERKQDEERIQFLANHDALTTLPNRTMFSEVLNIAIQNARRYSRNFAVLFIDLDRFKNINDTLGHEAGDRLLQEMGARLTQTVRASDVVARLGGDEFVVLVQEVSEARQAEAQDEHALMKNADIAMYRAKEDGKNNYKFYSEEMNVHSFERLALETSLRRGLERSEFVLHYQAKLDLRTERITGVEALVRWQHPEMGLVPPAQFIPLAEETGLIVPIGKWVLNTACAQNVAWLREGLPPLHMAVNLSARQFTDEDLVKDIAAALESTGLRPALLELELTESMVIQNTERAGRVLAEIKKMGVRLAIDDFGVGYSSLTHLKRFPIDTLKVDRSFIRDLPQDLEDKAITEAIIAMGKSLNLTVVAEGVETLEQQTFLHDHACDEMQGYFFSKPIPSGEFVELLRKRIKS